MDLATERDTYLWRMPRGDQSAVWRALLDFCLERADELRFSVSVEPQPSLELEPRWPPVRVRHSLSGAEILEALRNALGSPRRVERSMVRWGRRQRFESFHIYFVLNSAAVTYLLDSSPGPEGWSQHVGLPEDPALLRRGDPLLETISHEPEVLVFLQGTDVEELKRRGVELEPEAEARLD